MKPLLVISFYDRRPIEPLIALLDSLDRYPAGALHERMICVNSTGAQSLPASVTSRVDTVLERANTGMNIGAWDAAWRHRPNHPMYLFLQDECFAVRAGWLQDMHTQLQDLTVGLLGEAFNHSWDKPWALLREGAGRDALPEHFIDGKPANRVDVYLHHMRCHGIDPGAVGRHLRSLVWAARGEVLQAINGFVHGVNYGECIAAELGASRAIEARRLSLRQLGPSPFHAFRHREWNQDQPGGAFTHKPVLLRELQRLREEAQGMRSQLQQPSWGDLRRGFLARLARLRREMQA